MTPQSTPSMSTFETSWQLAQINIGCLRYDRSDDRLAGWRDNVDRINVLAEAAPGFVWRLSGAEGQDTGQRMFGDPRIVTNMSVWQSLSDFRQFVYRSEHAKFVRGRQQWFTPIKTHLAMWWIERGTYPNLDEGKEKLHRIEILGPNASAFTLSKVFEPSAMVLESPSDEEARSD